MPTPVSRRLVTTSRRPWNRLLLRWLRLRVRYVLPPPRSSCTRTRRGCSTSWPCCSCRGSRPVPRVPSAASSWVLTGRSWSTRVSRDSRGPSIRGLLGGPRDLSTDRGAMSRAKWILCNWILKLDRIPRYGRLYTYERDPSDPSAPLKLGKVEWTYQKIGHWGFYFLDRIGWLWPYEDEAERREHATPGSLRDRTDQGDRSRQVPALAGGQSRRQGLARRGNPSRHRSPGILARYVGRDRRRQKGDLVPVQGPVRRLPTDEGLPRSGP